MYEVLCSITDWLFSGGIYGDIVASIYVIWAVLCVCYLLVAVVGQTWAWLDDGEVHDSLDVESLCSIVFFGSLVVFLGGLMAGGVLLLAFLYWQVTVMLCIAVALAYTARGLRRLIKRVMSHENDKNAHK